MNIFCNGSKNFSGSNIQNFFSLIETITKLLQEHDEIKQSESSYKKECKKEIEALDKEIELLEQNENGDIVKNVFFQFFISSTF
jgi:FtsZ-binding cell division protein ZapB